MRAKKIIKNSNGMTLIEIMIVLAIVVGLMTTVGSNVMSRFQGSKVKQAKIQIGDISNKIEAYYIDCGSYPSTEDGLDALVTQPGSCQNWGPQYTKKSRLKDPWGNEFIYEKIGSSEFEIISLGADGQEGGEGLDADISNMDDEEEE